MRLRPSEIEEHQIGEIEYLLQYKRIRRMYLRLKPQESKVFVRPCLKWNSLFPGTGSGSGGRRKNRSRWRQNPFVNM